jgi:hypothetical protein
MARIDPASATGAMALDTILRAFAPPALPEPEIREWIENNRTDGDHDGDILMTFDPVEDIYTAVPVNLESVRSVKGYGRTVAAAQEDMAVKLVEYSA